VNRTPLLFLNVLIIATCGLIYELLAGTLASYVLGDSVTQFSIIIGVYLFAMGAGSWLSSFLDKDLAGKFIDIELGVALLGGLSAPTLFFTFAYAKYFYLILYLAVFFIGVLVGLEIPLLMRILKDELDFKALVSRVLAFDYIGALLASLLFPLLLVPRLGLVRTSLLFGMMNAGVALWGTWLLKTLIKQNVAILRVKALMVLIFLAVAFVKADFLTSYAEDGMFAETIIYAKSSNYQRIIVTQGRGGYSLFLNGNLQFNSFDEYRYHEALVHPAFAAFGRNAKRVLVLGGGDGLALREILKYDSIEFVQLVDLDPDMTNLSRRLKLLADLNQNAFDNPKVHVENADAFVWLDNHETNEKFDVAIVDFPDPNNFALGKLYTTRFYNLLKKHLHSDSTAVIQTTSPLFARNSFWCIIKTLKAAGFDVKPYQTTVPSFGIWGYALCKLQPFDAPEKAPRSVELKFLDDNAMRSLFVFPADLNEPAETIEVNRMNNQSLVKYYEAEWRRFEQ
jgi:spermidine synthase